MDDKRPNAADSGTARLAGPGDVNAIAVLLDAFNAEYGVPSPGPDALARRLGRLVEHPDAFMVVHGSPINSFGLVTLRPTVWADGPVATLDELYTVPEHRSRGVGSRVLAAVEAEAVARGAAELVVEVDEPDVDAQRFYDRHGLPLRESATGDRAFVLRKELAP